MILPAMGVVSECISTFARKVIFGYWHFVDIVWIFLFPLFYLIDCT